MPVRTLRELFNAFKEMPYYKNHAAASGAVHNYSKHEDALAAKMIEFGYKENSCGKLWYQCVRAERAEHRSS